ncbi:MAG: ClpXP protease specificity-enhancing factor [Gammaproteobacteria bacterium]|nr:ClpXP protease specificity-enhancing factor [Gammaproteobacteria bacterium]NNJ71622.1 ClpXP protease specificity-enhancing factor [Enterobacterales bacterium]
MTSNQPYLFRAIYDWIVDNDMTPYALINAEASYVKVPQQSVNEGQIILNISPSAVVAFHSDNEALSFSARFSGVEQSIYIPMPAILAIYAAENGQGMAFSLDNEELETDSDDSETEEVNQKNSESKPFLKVIK